MKWHNYLKLIKFLCIEYCVNQNEMVYFLNLRKVLCILYCVNQKKMPYFLKLDKSFIYTMLCESK